MLNLIDHLVFATPDLEAGILHVENMFGVEATPGGRHPGFGTQNALVSLGRHSYLEIVGPDPLRDTAQAPDLFELAKIDRPQLVTWAAKSDDLETLTARAHGAGVELGDVSTGSRMQPDGTLLEWRLTDPYRDRKDGIIPFFIDWGSTPHPALSLSQPCLLVHLVFSHTDPSPVEDALRAVTDEHIPVSRSNSRRITATVRTPKGLVELE